MDTLGREYGWTVDEILSMPKSQVFACLDAISNRYAREAEAYKKAEGKSGSSDITDIDEVLRTNPSQLKAFGAVVK
jgi:hypothetical protein